MKSRKSKSALDKIISSVNEQNRDLPTVGETKAAVTESQPTSNKQTQTTPTPTASSARINSFSPKENVVAHQEDISPAVTAISEEVQAYNKVSAANTQRIEESLERAIYEFSKIFEDIHNRIKGNDKNFTKYIKHDEGKFSKLISELKSREGITSIPRKQDDEAVKPFTKQKGFAAGFRRGVVDPNADVSEDSVLSFMGRMVSKMVLPFTDIGGQEREAMAEKYLYPSKIKDRALSDNPEALTKEDIRGLDRLYSSVQRGEQDLGGLTVEEYMKQAQKSLIWEKNLGAVKKTETADTFNQYINKHRDLIPSDLLEQYTQSTTPEAAPEPQEPEKRQVRPTPEPAIRDGIPALATPSSTEVPAAQREEMSKLIDELMTPYRERYNTVKKLDIKEMLIKSLRIGLMQVDSGDMSNVTQAGNNAPGLDVPDIDLGKKGKRLGKVSRLSRLGSGLTSFAMGAAPLLAIAEASREAEAADINNTEDFNIFSSVGRLGKSFSEMFSGVFGSPSDSAELTRIKTGVEERGDVYTPIEAAKIKEKYGYEIPATSIAPSNVAPIPDQKQAELSSANMEHERLLEQQKEAESKNSSNININAPTNVVSKGGGSVAPMPSVRASFTAYERFVDRVFTAL